MSCAVSVNSVEKQTVGDTSQDARDLEDTIPAVPVGSHWKFRVQVSEAGVHRPQVAGIHGRENEDAYSIVLSGGYEDDEVRGSSGGGWRVET